MYSIHVGGIGSESSNFRRHGEVHLNIGKVVQWSWQEVQNNLNTGIWTKLIVFNHRIDRF